MVSVSVMTCGTGISQYANANISVYPNPSTAVFNIQGSAELGVVEVYNTIGKLVLKTMVKDTQTQIDLSKQAAGMYYIILQEKNIKVSKQ